MVKPSFIRNIQLPISLVSLLGLGVLGFILIVQNADYSRSSIEVPLQNSPSGSVKTSESFHNTDKEGWKLVSLEYDFKNPTYFNGKNVKRAGAIVSFWQKQIYDIPSAEAPPSKRTGFLIYEAQEYYQADCQSKRIKGPLTGLYWTTDGKALLDPPTHNRQWVFSAQWLKAATFKPDILWNVCDYTDRQHTIGKS